jgi:glycosyltransferase involved in cell wall biosynthesis
MKIAIVTPYHWSDRYGGAEYQISLLIGEIARRHPELELHYICKPSTHHITPSDHAIRGLAEPRWYTKYGTFFDAPSLYRTLSDLRPDAIYQRVGCGYTGVCAAYAKRPGVNMVWHIALDTDVKPGIDSPALKKPHHWLEKKLLEFGVRNTPKIVAQKRSQADDLRAYYGRDVDAIIPNFQPAPDFEKDHLASPHVVWIANHKPAKNPEAFLDLAERLSASTEVRCSMVGRPADNSWGRAIVERAKASPAVDYVGELSQESLNALLETAHIMINTSDNEGFPNTFIQSWMREVPVLSLHVDPDGALSGNGIGMSCGDIDTLYTQTLTLINDTEKRIAMARKARTYALATHSLNNAENVVKLLMNKNATNT